MTLTFFVHCDKQNTCLSFMYFFVITVAYKDTSWSDKALREYFVYRIQ